MEFFNKSKTIRLRSHLNKFLAADDDQQTVRQSRNPSSTRSRWTVEMVEGKSHVIRLKSCSSGKYLTPSGEPFLLGWTGKKVVQDTQANKRDSSVEWEPIKEGGQVKLRAKGGKFLRANGGTPPWRNSVTYDIPHRTATQDWVLWDVEVVDLVGLESQESVMSDLSPATSFSSVPDIGRVTTNGSPRVSGRQNGMELFHKAKAVRLQGYHGKYLVADDDEVTVRQSHNGSSSKARWTIEYVDGNPNAIRLKSCHGLYLSATNEAFLLGMTGKKVQQYPNKIKPDSTTIWEPIREGLFHVKLQTNDGKFLRANGGTPPWRNSITHDIPHRTATQDWVLWGVDVVDISLSDTESVMSSLSSFSSVVDDYCGSPDTGSPLSVVSQSSKVRETKLSGGMELFRKAKSVRLKSHHDKYLLAELHGETVSQDRQGTTKSAIWNVEFVDGLNNVVRLKSVNGKYLTASEDQIILGVTGRKVVQSMPQKLDSSIEWEPIRDGFQVRLKTRYGNFLRANGGLPPWRNSITHDIPHKHHNWILWDVEIVEARPEEPPPPPLSPPLSPPIDEVVAVSSETMNPDLDSSSFRLTTHTLGRTETNAKMEGRMIYYAIADDDGHVGNEERWFTFKGHGLEDLTRNLEEETEIDDIIVCSRNPLNDKLFPLRLALPPNNSTMEVVVVPLTSKVAKDLLPVST